VLRMLRVLAVIVLLFGAMVGFSAGQNLPEPILAYSQMPKYPPLAIAARIEGSVKLSLVLNEQGEVVLTQVTSGHPILKSAAAAIVKRWRFDMPHDLYRTEWRYETEFVYGFSGREVMQHPKLTISLESFHRIEITSDVVKPTTTE
jgi:TonB family protein